MEITINYQLIYSVQSFQIVREKKSFFPTDFFVKKSNTEKLRFQTGEI